MLKWNWSLTNISLALFVHFCITCIAPLVKNAKIKWEQMNDLATGCNVSVVMQTANITLGIHQNILIWCLISLFVDDGWITWGKDILPFSTLLLTLNRNMFINCSSGSSFEVRSKHFSAVHCAHHSDYSSSSRRQRCRLPSIQPLSSAIRQFVLKYFR